MKKKLSVHILDDDIWEIPNKTFSIQFSNFRGVGTNFTSILITILDNDGAFVLCLFQMFFVLFRDHRVMLICLCETQPHAFIFRNKLCFAFVF